MMNDESNQFLILHSEFIIVYRGMVSMVSMEVSKTLGPGSSPGTPAKPNF
jgi:hypothetical protein